MLHNEVRNNAICPVNLAAPIMFSESISHFRVARLFPIHVTASGRDYVLSGDTSNFYNDLLLLRI